MKRPDPNVGTLVIEDIYLRQALAVVLTVLLNSNWPQTEAGLLVAHQAMGFGIREGREEIKVVQQGPC